jgi:catechol 2,3-dioxygenase-like lactoylglutathione lyase family enzyme
MIDHISIAVSDLAKSAAFYESVLAPLELTRLVGSFAGNRRLRAQISGILAQCARTSGAAAGNDGHPHLPARAKRTGG